MECFLEEEGPKSGSGWISGPGGWYRHVPEEIGEGQWFEGEECKVSSRQGLGVACGESGKLERGDGGSQKALA